MRIERIELRKIFLPYVSVFETSGWREQGSHAIIVRIEAEGLVAWGESPVGENPFYNEENQKTAWIIMQDYLVPILLQTELASPWDVTPAFARIRGNRMAKAGLEFAVWDLFARREGRSLASLLGGVRERVEVGVSVGIQKDIPTLLKVVEGYLNEGYTRIKLKIKPGWDVEPTRAVRETWPNLRLQVDANSIYRLEDAAHLAELDRFNLLLIEQPLAHDDIFDHAKLKPQLKTPLCLDESIVSPDHARWAIEMKACDVINIKPSRIGGLGDAKRIHDMAQAAGIPVWHGGMLETGIGRAINVALASLPNFTLPGDISANDRYFKRDIVRNPFTLNPDSTLTVPTGVGHGAIVDEDYLDDVTTERWELALTSRNAP
ncbi:o-succinylbenzoate synthase [Caldilinea sp.]|uniref:o-succinylbenzoate synthase n=1 Tax=Caldilinea sp. TaxID=2293560 RepID=UPI0021DC84D1|nr:o-succinylbenzoate synthase [Caldilinea sp.]GIV67208.1 MAG: o-succinylbenzoate synthase [Caldilinea sp.]